MNKFVVVGKVVDSDETTGYVLKNRETNEIGIVSRYAALELARRNDLTLTFCSKKSPLLKWGMNCVPL